MNAVRSMMLLLAGTAISAPAAADVTLELIGRYATNEFDESAAEIPDYDPETRRLFVVNGATDGIDILDLSNPASPTKIGEMDLKPYGHAANSVSVKNGLVAIAVATEDKTQPGKAVFYTVMGEPKGAVELTAQPDMIKFTPDGNYVLTANEGEMSEESAENDPEGTIGLIDLTGGIDTLDQSDVTILDFKAYGMEAPAGARIGVPGVSFAVDAEPEYIAVSGDSMTAWVAMQEQSAIAIVDIASKSLKDVVGMGYKDHSAEGNGLDASNRDGGINIQTWPVLGMYHPDSIYAYEVGGATYIVTANEGDSRDWDGFSEEERVKDLTLDPTVFPNAKELQMDENLGRLKTTTSNGDTDGDGDFDEIYSYGARSFSVLSATGEMLWDSGDDFEQITAQRIPGNFNSTNDENGSFDDRSDDKGPEPEAITVGTAFGTPYVFIGLERVGGIMIYDFSTPTAPAFVDYITTRDFAGNAEEGTAGDLAPEGFAFIPADQSPNGQPLLVTGNEVSGTVAIFQVVQK